MDVFRFYLASTAGWYGVQFLALFVTPKLVVLLLSSDAQTPTDLESYLCRALASALLALTVLTLLLTGAIPLSIRSTEDQPPAYSSSPIPTPSPSPSSPSTTYLSPSLTILSIFNTVTAIAAYTRYLSTSLNGFALGAFGYGTLAVLGGWCLMFGNESRRVSKRTGKDKRTSGWPFGKGVGKGVMLRKGEAKES